MYGDTSHQIGDVDERAVAKLSFVLGVGGSYIWRRESLIGRRALPRGKKVRQKSAVAIRESGRGVMAAWQENMFSN